MKAIFFVVALILAGCYSDEVTKHYQTIQEANQRTWLPDIVPESTIDIEESNNVDFNTSVGDFHYNPAASATFFAKLSNGAPAKSPYTSWASIVQDHVEDGFIPWSYRADGSDWVFFCNHKDGHCYFYSWPIRERA